MEVEEKIKQFTEVVLREATIHRDTILEKSANEYSKACDDYRTATKNKFDKMFEEEKNRLNREAQRDVVVAQADFKRQLIAKRTEQIEHMLFNINKKLDEYVKTEQYVESLIKSINEKKGDNINTIVYLMERDLKYKDIIENRTGVRVLQSKENFIGGFKITITDSRMIDCSFKTRLEEEMERFNKIKIN